MATSRLHPFVSSLGLFSLVLGCAGGQGAGASGSGGASTGGVQGGATGMSVSSFAKGSAGSGAGAGGTSSVSAQVGRSGGAGATGASGGAGAGGGTSLAGSGGRSATTGLTGGNGGGESGAGGVAGTGGHDSTPRDAGFDAQPENDARPDLAGERPPADAASLPGTHNPVFPGVFADPHIAVFDDTFYIYPTTDGVANWGATAFSVFTSKNLVQWTKGPVIFDVAKDLTWAKGRAWAPAIARAGATYYFYFSAEVQLGVATSSSPLGPFKDALGAPLVKTAQYSPQSIDPYVFIDDDDTRYLLFGSGGGGLRMAKLKADMISFANTPANISPSGAGGTLEGVGMFKRKGSYYLYWSEGDTRNASYKMAYARASSVSGPFTRLATILEQNAALGILGPGGGTILAIASRDEHAIAYHRFKIPGGDGTNRETCIDRLTFNSDGTIAPVKPTLEGLQSAVAP